MLVHIFRVRQQLPSELLVVFGCRSSAEGAGHTRELGPTVFLVNDALRRGTEETVVALTDRENVAFGIMLLQIPQSGSDVETLQRLHADAAGEHRFVNYPARMAPATSSTACSHCCLGWTSSTTASPWPVRPSSRPLASAARRVVHRLPQQKRTTPAARHRRRPPLRSASPTTIVLTVTQTRPSTSPYMTRGKTSRPSPNSAHGPVALPASKANPPSSTGPGIGPDVPGSSGG